MVKWCAWRWPERLGWSREDNWSDWRFWGWGIEWEQRVHACDVCAERGDCTQRNDVILLKKTVFFIRIPSIFQSHRLNHSFHDCHCDETRFIYQNPSYWKNCLNTSILINNFLTDLFCYLELCSDHCCDQIFFSRIWIRVQRTTASHWRSHKFLLRRPNLAH